MKESRLVCHAEEKPQWAFVTVVLPRRLPQTRRNLSAYPPQGCSSLPWGVSIQHAELKNACSPWVTPRLCLQGGCEEEELVERFQLVMHQKEVQKSFVERCAMGPRPRPQTQLAHLMPQGKNYPGLATQHTGSSTCQNGKTNLVQGKSIPALTSLWASVVSASD